MASLRGWKDYIYRWGRIKNKGRKEGGNGLGYVITRSMERHLVLNGLVVFEVE